MRDWHFNRVITTYGKRDCRNSWRYESLAVNRGAIKQGFTVFQKESVVSDPINQSNAVTICIVVTGYKCQPFQKNKSHFLHLFQR
jgi:hypothetical protein